MTEQTDESSWTALTGDGITEGYTWHKTPFFVQRVLDQLGESICSMCAAGYLIEFANSRQLKVATEMPVQWLIDYHFNEKVDALLRILQKEKLCLAKKCDENDKPPATLRKFGFRWKHCSFDSSVAAEEIVRKLRFGRKI